MKMVCKKLLSLVLVALMLVTALPFQASAADDQIHYVVQHNGTQVRDGHFSPSNGTDSLVSDIIRVHVKPTAEETKALKAAEEQKALKAAEEQKALKAAEEQKALKAAEEQKALKAAEEQKALKAAEEKKALKAAEEKKAAEAAKPVEAPKPAPKPNLKKAGKRRAAK